jgi:hypothetical protein
MTMFVGLVSRPFANAPRATPSQIPKVRVDKSSEVGIDACLQERLLQVNGYDSLAGNLRTEVPRFSGIILRGASRRTRRFRQANPD